MAQKKIATAEELGKRIDAFIQAVQSGDIAQPTDYRLCEFLGISVDTLERYTKRDKDTGEEKDIYKGYAEQLKKLLAFREDWYLSQAVANPRSQTINIFALKQAKNGGWIDRQQVDGNGKLDLSISLKTPDGETFKPDK